MPRTKAVKADNDMLPEYDLSGGVRGKYLARYQRMKKKILLDPDVARVFASSEEVNTALRAFAAAAARSVKPSHPASRRRHKAG